MKTYLDVNCNIKTKRHRAKYLLIPISTIEAQELIKQYMPIYYNTTLSI
jgi:hypothetical protein